MTAKPEQVEINDSLPPLERSFRTTWVVNLRRTDAQRPVLTPDFVSRQGRAVRVVDIRDESELIGELGYVPGSDWIPGEEAGALTERIGPWEPLVLVSADGVRAAEMAAHLEVQGLKLVAAMSGGMRAWNEFGLSPSRDRGILRRRGQLTPLSGWSNAVSQRALEASEVQEHFGHPLSVRWIKLAALMTHGRMSCVDGRDHTGVVGSPGGDGGEFVLAIAALEARIGKALDEEALDTLFRRRLDSFGRFAIHTDTHAGDRLIASMRAEPRLQPYVAGMTHPLEWRKFFSAPPQEIRPVMHELLRKPASIGCGHLRLMVQHPDRYAVRPGLVESMLQLIAGHRWQGAPEVEISPLPGGHAEGAVINVHVAGRLRAFSRVPLISPAFAGRQMFVNHPDVAAYLRHELAVWLCQQDDLLPIAEADADGLFERMQRIHQQQLIATLKELAAGLPIFDVTFRRDGSVDVKPAGNVPKP